MRLKFSQNLKGMFRNSDVSKLLEQKELIPQEAQYLLGRFYNSLGLLETLTGIFKGSDKIFQVPVKELKAACKKLEQLIAKTNSTSQQPKSGFGNRPRSL